MVIGRGTDWSPVDELRHEIRRLEDDRDALRRELDFVTERNGRLIQTLANVEPMQDPEETIG